MLLAPQAPRLAVEGSHVDTDDFRYEDVRIPLYYNGIGGSFPQESVCHPIRYLRRDWWPDLKMAFVGGGRKRGFTPPLQAFVMQAWRSAAARVPGRLQHQTATHPSNVCGGGTWLGRRGPRGVPIFRGQGEKASRSQSADDDSRPVYDVYVCRSNLINFMRLQ